MKIYQTYKHAKRFFNLTGINLRTFVDIMPTGDVVLDTFKLEEYFKPNEDESLKECLQRQLTPSAVKIIEDFLYK